ncbi:hypothetical protein HZY62_05945 [Maribacter polysiphoniae]|uniref:Uncharacterized protein n=1 Tax=Maribacter polysiphoniae TaxID=429344 RepID=A0A316E7G1_9FLAO|nr:hypothetical protein [Maribacter polysiphoniae]MBD1260118.1 hypothetical protein [Maribacter polysiphoniae]PWK25578.1 hypothetical protein LX92_00320 [Maribacter polysiphoniae]
MTKSTLGRFIKTAIAVLFLMVFGSCISSKSNYQREYTRLWKEIIKSEAWKNSLVADNSKERPTYDQLYATTSEDVILEDDYTTHLDREALFEVRFESLVSRAYFKIIAEAEHADSRLRAEYDRWNSMQQDSSIAKDRTFRKDLGKIIKKYNAHKRMLEGLKSWNIFSEFRSNDLDFFKAENKNEVYRMYTTGSTEDHMIGYLMYRLADLYHNDNH